MSPMDKFLFTDKDNIFLSIKTTTVDQMSYMRDATINYELETLTGFGVKAMLALVLCGTLEYITSWLMEKLFHARWWDYSKKRFNINGRVCASNLLAFGVMGVFVVKVLKPFAFGLFAKIPPVWLDVISITLTALLIADVAISAGVLTKIRGAAESVRADNTEAITKAVREALMAQGFLLRHPLHAFPEVQFYNKAHLARLKAKHDELQANMREKREKLQQELDRLEEKRKALKKGKK